MKKTALALLFCGVSAFATTVTYSTSAVLSGPDASTNELITAGGGAIIGYTGVSSTNVTSPTNINIGEITLSVTSSGTFDPADSISLTVTQSAPSAGSSSTSSTITGSVTGTSSGVDIDFSPQTFMIGAVTYTLEPSYFVVAPNTNNGVTSLQANVSVSPEPASLGLLGASLLGLGIAFRRRAVK
jgi:hypothetical protein